MVCRASGFPFSPLGTRAMASRKTESSLPHMLKRMSLMLLGVLIFVAIIAALKVMRIKAAMAEGAAHAPGPDAVSTVIVKPQSWQPVINAVGSLKAVNGVMVSTDMPGVVSEIAFKSGAEVKKGNLLVKMDTQQEEAQLQSAEAKRDLAKLDLQRKRDLIDKKAIASSDWDTAESALRQAEAAVTDAKALIARKRITAPFDGMLGIRHVDLGQYVEAGAQMISLQSLDPINVEFALPQQHLESVGIGKKLRVRAAGLSEEWFSGEITAIDSRLDESTHNLMVEGTLPNADRKLRPGMFVSVEVYLPEQDSVLAVPSSAIRFAPYGDSVFILADGVGPDGKPGKVVKQQFVKLGATRGDQVTITSGLKGGEEVVSAGVFRLRPDGRVRVNNEVQPGNELQPKPPDS